MKGIIRPRLPGRIWRRCFFMRLRAAAVCTSHVRRFAPRHGDDEGTLGAQLNLAQLGEHDEKNALHDIVDIPRCYPEAPGRDAHVRFVAEHQDAVATFERAVRTLIGLVAALRLYWFRVGAADAARHFRLAPAAEGSTLSPCSVSLGDWPGVDRFRRGTSDPMHDPPMPPTRATDLAERTFV